MLVIVKVVVEIVFLVVNLKKLIVNLNMYDKVMVIIVIVWCIGGKLVFVMLLYFFIVI